VRDTILCGDAWATLDRLPSAMCQMVITSPPYFGHRKYAEAPDLVDLEFGREAEPAEYVAKLVALGHKLARVLLPNGTLWLNLGDAYRDGQLLGMPWRTALALQDAGWLLRSEIIWNKTNAMPSSVRDRPTLSHEHIFLFARSRDYFYDADAIREPHVTFTPLSRMKGGRRHLGVRGGTPENGKNAGNSNLHDARWDRAFHPLGRNKRSVWDMPVGKYREAHFAVFPEWLAETCIKAGSRPEDTVLDPFMGSGTTAVVARGLDRHFVGIELVPRYCELAVARLGRATSAESSTSDQP
jgi:DNA modification methylase